MAGFLARLRFVVLDESTLYRRGIFGSHVAGVIRLAAAVCALRNARQTRAGDDSARQTSGCRPPAIHLLLRDARQIRASWRRA